MTELYQLARWSKGEESGADWLRIAALPFWATDAHRVSLIDPQVEQTDRFPYERFAVQVLRYRRAVMEIVNGAAAVWALA